MAPRTPVLLLGAAGAASLLLVVAVAGASGAPASSPTSALQGAVGRFFTWAELTASSKARALGLDNTPTPQARRALQLLVHHLIDPLQARLPAGQRLRVTSGYRAPAINAAVHGSDSSQHMAGEALDFVLDGFHSESLATAIVHLGLPFDQVIWYAPERGGHVHVSWTERRANRGQTLHAPATGGYVAWKPKAPIA